MIALDSSWLRGHPHLAPGRASSTHAGVELLCDRCGSVWLDKRLFYASRDALIDALAQISREHEHPRPKPLTPEERERVRVQAIHRRGAWRQAR